MLVFLDFEASSLGKQGFPIEIGWVFEDGTSEGHLIRPAPRWKEWDREAEAIHHISRAQLDAEGKPHDEVARRMVEALDGHSLHASAPSWDGKWLSALLRAAGLPRHALRPKDTETVQMEAAGDVPEAIAAELLRQARVTVASQPATHRAIADAERERQIWLEVRRLAENL